MAETCHPNAQSQRSSVLVASSSGNIPRCFACSGFPVSSTEGCSGDNCGTISDEETIVLVCMHTSANITWSHLSQLAMKWNDSPKY